MKIQPTGHDLIPIKPISRLDTSKKEENLIRRQATLAYLYLKYEGDSYVGRKRKV